MTSLPLQGLITEVWASNLKEEFERIRDVVEHYQYIAMDTEFPGIVARPTGNVSEYSYQTVKCNVDLLKVIQLGITFADSHGNLPTRTATWQFNFRFDLERDMYAQDSIDFLRDSGIDFERHQSEGIDLPDFGELMISSGLVMCEYVRWISFHGCYDFGYLLKLLTCSPLPSTEAEFFDLLHDFFPALYDIKYLLRNVPNSSLSSGVSLQRLSEHLHVERVGPQHQAGSDSLVTGKTFFKLMATYFANEIDDSIYSGYIYGIGNAHDPEMEMRCGQVIHYPVLDKPHIIMNNNNADNINNINNVNNTNMNNTSETSIGGTADILNNNAQLLNDSHLLDKDPANVQNKNNNMNNSLPNNHKITNNILPNNNINSNLGTINMSTNIVGTNIMGSNNMGNILTGSLGNNITGNTNNISKSSISSMTINIVSHNISANLNSGSNSMNNNMSSTTNTSNNSMVNNTNISIQSTNTTRNNALGGRFDLKGDKIARSRETVVNGENMNNVNINNSNNNIGNNINMNNSMKNINNISSMSNMSNISTNSNTLVSFTSNMMSNTCVGPQLRPGPNNGGGNMGGEIGSEVSDTRWSQVKKNIMNNVKNMNNISNMNNNIGDNKINSMSKNNMSGSPLVSNSSEENARQIDNSFNSILSPEHPRNNIPPNNIPPNNIPPNNNTTPNNNVTPSNITSNNIKPNIIAPNTISSTSTIISSNNISNNVSNSGILLPPPNNFVATPIDRQHFGWHDPGKKA